MRSGWWKRQWWSSKTLIRSSNITSRIGGKSRRIKKAHQEDEKAEQQ